MNRPNWKSLLLGMVVVLGTTVVVSEAKAGWWWGAGPVYGYGVGGYGVGYGGWGPGIGACDPCWGSSWYLGYRPGPIRRLLLGPCRWYPGVYAPWSCCTSYCGCDNGCYGVPACAPAVPACGVVTGSAVLAPAPAPGGAMMPTAPAPGISENGSLTPTPATPTPAPAKKPAETPNDLLPQPGLPSPAAPGSSSPLRLNPGKGPGDFSPALPGGPTTMLEPSHDKIGVLTIWVPAEAKVTINGLPTQSTGSKRQYVSFGLKPGFAYKYDVRAEVVRDGQVVEEARSVTLTAGQRAAVAFGFNASAAQVATSD